MKARDIGFYLGIITALAHLAEHDEQSIYEEIVEMCDLKELVMVARNNGELEFSGLVRYGFTDSNGRIVKNREE